MNGAFVDCCMTVHLRTYSAYRFTNCLVCVSMSRNRPLMNRNDALAECFLLTLHESLWLQYLNEVCY